MKKILLSIFKPKKQFVYEELITPKKHIGLQRVLKIS